TQLDRAFRAIDVLPARTRRTRETFDQLGFGNANGGGDGKHDATDSTGATCGTSKTLSSRSGWLHQPDMMSGHDPTYDSPTRDGFSAGRSCATAGRSSDCARSAPAIRPWFRE